MADMTPSPESVLIYSCGETIGDGLFKLPFLQDCRARFSTAHITWLAGTGPTTYASVLAPAVHTLVDEVIEHGGVGLSGWEIISPRAPLGGRRFDLVVDTQRNVARSLAVRRIRHRVYVSGTADFLLSDRKPPKGFVRPKALNPQLSALLDLVSDRPAGAKEPQPVDVTDAYRDLAAELLPSGPVYVGISPGAGDGTKIWPLDRFLQIARDQAAAGRTPVMFLGPEERDLLGTVAAAVPEAIFPEWNRADGRQNLKGPSLVIALAGRLDAAVANDSGTGHMLAIGGAPLVSLFSKHDPEKYAPAARRLEIVDSKTYGGEDPDLIPISAVTNALDRLLATERPEGDATGEKETEL